MINSRTVDQYDFKCFCIQSMHISYFYITVQSSYQRWLLAKKCFGIWKCSTLRLKGSFFSEKAKKVFTLIYLY